MPLKDISYGSPIPKLPIDPINQTSTGEYYTYFPGGSWELTALLTSQKYQEKAINDGDAFPSVYSIRTSPKPLTPGTRDKGLIGYWDMDSFNNEIVYDRSGSGFNGIMYSSYNTFGNILADNGKIGKCLRTSRVNEFNGLAINPFIYLSKFTISAWINLNSLPNYTNQSDPWNYIYTIAIRTCGGDCSAKHNFWFELSETKKLTGGFYSEDGNFWFKEKAAESFTSTDLNKWLHVAFTVDKDKSNYLYLNGQKITNLEISDSKNKLPVYTPTGTVLSIGFSYKEYPAKKAFDGCIDEVRIYNRALSDQEIKAIYEATK